MHDESQLRQRAIDADREQYQCERRDAIERLTELCGSGPVPLSSVSMFLPENPEWLRLYQTGH